MRKKCDIKAFFFFCRSILIIVQFILFSIFFPGTYLHCIRAMESHGLCFELPYKHPIRISNFKLFKLL